MNSVDTTCARQAYAQKFIHSWLVDMLFRRRIREVFAPKALSTEEIWAQESSRLAEKRAAQIQWMEKRGIDIKLKDSERPRPSPKPPLPGTVIYFSNTFERRDLFVGR